MRYCVTNACAVYIILIFFFLVVVSDSSVFFFSVFKWRLILNYQSCTIYVKRYDHIIGYIQLSQQQNVRLNSIWMTISLLHNILLFR